ncbi:hypothetical protein DERF_002442 [Dermatophagoides farinae]|uniref:Uncharacterized protein n=1 Tax=Dermatophagoides farinae TaxID=6954 RepID=A0A922IBN2_DERFA|nr:hypothetical protein DERF_002442 [Dermatophagoides farinae]
MNGRNCKNKNQKCSHCSVCDQMNSGDNLPTTIGESGMRPILISNKRLSAPCVFSARHLYLIREFGRGFRISSIFLNVNINVDMLIESTIFVLTPPLGSLSIFNTYIEHEESI